MSAPPVEARQLVKVYGDVVAVDHVDLTVEAGDVFGYLGPNGAGKTTSLRMLLGLIRPTSGVSRLFGRDPLEEGARALDGVAGFVEGPRFYPYLTGRKNLRLLADYDGKGVRDRIEEVLELVELRDRAKHRVGGYSHGMRQRLGIAASLLREPKLLLLDEPATGLDPAGMRDMRDLVRRLAGEGITVLLSSHLLAEVEELCNRVAIIRKGRIVYEGGLDALLATASSGYLLRTDDAERTEAICRDQPGIEARPAGDGPPPQRRRGRGRRAHHCARPRRDRRHGARPADRLAGGALPRHDRGDRARCGAGACGARCGGGCVITVYRWEIVEAPRAEADVPGLGAAVLIPLAFVTVLVLKNGSPDEALLGLGSHVRDTGLIVPFVVLFFMSAFAFPLITSLVAGDIVASETQNGTLKTILTRSKERGQVFTGKALAALTYMVAALAAMAIVGLSAGVSPGASTTCPRRPGPTVSAGRGLWLLIVALGYYAVRSPGSRPSASSSRPSRATAPPRSSGRSCGTSRWACCSSFPARSRSGPTCSSPSSTPGTGCCAFRWTGRRWSTGSGSRPLHRRPARRRLLIFLRRDVAGD